mmetsp:Transcript_15248/g.23220  ORF Transcript_15248/g.23220 Transcript_15248/m.23220 type:complete len:91 (+) Transcript_15248:1319-1591(+)
MDPNDKKAAMLPEITENEVRAHNVFGRLLSRSVEHTCCSFTSGSILRAAGINMSLQICNEANKIIVVVVNVAVHIPVLIRSRYSDWYHAA